MMDRKSHAWAFLDAVMPQGTCLEMRIFKAQLNRSGQVEPFDRFPSNIAGWYDDPAKLIADTDLLRGASAYVTFNSVDPALLSRSDNKLARAPNMTKDENILCLRWLYIDIDPVRPADISSNAEEFGSAIKRRGQILRDNPDLAHSALWGSSGNGAWILVRLPDLPNDAGSCQHVASALEILSARYSDDAVKVDLTTKNPSRVMCLPGTIKCKGNHRTERPWRWVSVDGSSPDRQPFDLAQWVSVHAPSEPAAGQAAQQPALALGGLMLADDSPDRLRRAVAYAGALPGAVSGQGGHAQTFDAACALMEGFALPTDEARPILEAWNARCDPPWSVAELEHKLADAGKIAACSPRIGYLLNAPRPGLPARFDAAQLPANVNGNGNGPPAEPPEPGPGDGPCSPGMEDNPHRLAKLFISREHGHPEGIGLRFWSDQFYVWKNAHYRPATTKEIRGAVAGLMHAEFLRIYAHEIIREGMKEPAQRKPVRMIPVTTTRAGDVVQALWGLSGLPSAKYPAQPAWIDGASDWPASEILPMRNAIVHLPTRATMPPTPALFAAHALDYPWQPDAPAPVHWAAFLESLWPGDRESIGTLQEWFGLNLVPDTSYQKMMALIGPPGSGKGTAARIMQSMIGITNCASVRFSVLENLFTLESVIGKLSMVIPDGRLSPKSDQAAILESILSISGEDTLTIARKHITAWTGKLSARITLVSNDLPRFSDASSALSRRLLVLRFAESFEGREDKGLEAKLLTELPGILLWAIEGWERLRARGHFVQPESGIEMKDEIGDLASPIGVFVRERLVIGEHERIRCADLYLAWKQWCEANGIKEPGTKAVFGRNLRSCVPGIRTPQAREGGTRSLHYAGARLLTTGELAAREDEDESDAPPF